MSNFNRKYQFNPFQRPDQQQQSFQVFNQQNVNRNYQNQQNNNVNFTFSFFPQNFENSYQPQPNDSKYKVFFYKIFLGFQFKSFIFVVSAIQILFYVAELIIYYFLAEKDTNWACVLMKMQAKYLPKIHYQYEYQRLLVPIFLHASFIHLFFNLLSQLIFGFVLEKYFSLKFFIPIYFLSGVAGNLLSCITSSETISVGASSAIFGIFGLQICYYLANYQRLGENKKIILGIFLAFVFLQFISQIQSNQQQANQQLQQNSPNDSVVDIGSHLGGLISGFLFGFLFYENPDDFKLKLKKKIAAGALIFLYAASFLWVILNEPKFISKQSSQNLCSAI